MSRLKKLIAIGTTATMLLWSFGMVLPAAHAATIADGDLVKSADSSAVYYIQGANKRVFPHYNVYLSWGYPGDFSTVKTVSASELAAYADDNSMPFRDGSLFRGTAVGLGGLEATAVYYVEGSELRPVLSEQVYQGLFSDTNWVRVTWVPDDLLTKFNYDMGADLTTSATHPNGCVVQYTGTTQKYVIEGGQKRAISDAAFSANRYLADSVVTIDTDEVYATGTSITGVESGLLTPGWVATTTATTALTVSLDSSNPAAMTLADGATNVNLLAIKLVAGASDVAVSELRFERSDIGASNEWSDLYLYEGNNRLTAIGRTLNVDHEVSFPSLGVSIAANSSKVITIRGDISAGNSTVGSRHAFKLVDVVTDATNVNTVLLTGNVMTIGSQNAGTATISEGTTPSNPTVGAQGVEVLQFKINNTSTNQNITFDQVVFTFSGTMSRADITNLKLKLIGETTVLASVSTIASNDTLTFTLDSPYTVLKGVTKIFSVFADLTGEAAETLAFYVDQTNHLVVTDSQYNVGATVIIDGTIDESTDTLLRLQGGTLTLADNGPIAGKISKNANDVVLTEFAMTCDRGVEVRRLSVTLDSASDTDNSDGDISDLRIIDTDTGATLMSAIIEADADGVDKAYTLTNTFNLTAGVTRNLAITVDVGSDDPDSGDYSFTSEYLSADLAMVAKETDVYIYDANTGQYLASGDVVPATITGENQQILASDISFGLASTPVSDTYTKNATDVSSMGVIITAGEASNVNIRQIKFRVGASEASGVYTTSVNPTTVVTALKLYDGTTLLGSKVVSGWTQTLDYGTVTFDGLDVDIVKGNNKQLVVKADLNSGITTQSYYYIALEGSDDHTTAYDADSNTLDIADGDDVNTTPTVEITASLGGTLAMALDGDTPVAAAVIGGASNVAVTKVKFTSTDEEFTINKLKVALATSTYSRAVTGVSLSYPGGTSSVGTLDTAGTVTFRDLAWTVEKDASEVLTIYANLNTIINGAQSGDQIKFNVTCDTAGNCEAVGASSVVKGDGGSELDDITTGSIQYLRKTKPTVTLATDSASEAFTPGWTALGTFDIAADSSADLELAKIQWTLQTNGTAWKTDVTAADFRVYLTTNMSDELSDNTGVTVSYTSSTGVAIAWADAYRPVVAAGSSKSYLLEADTLSSAGNGYAIDQGLAAGVDALVSSYIDSDASGDTTTDIDFIWDDEVNSTYATHTGYLIDALNPLDGNTRNYDK